MLKGEGVLGLLAVSSLIIHNISLTESLEPTLFGGLQLLSMDQFDHIAGAQVQDPGNVRGVEQLAFFFHCVFPHPDESEAPA